MPHFTYTALRPDGSRMTGTVEAWSAQAARDALKQMHVVVEDLSESAASDATPDKAAARIEAIPAAASATDTPEVRSPKSEVLPSHNEQQTTYFPLLDTLRLYAGWLLAWYCLVYALGSYQHTRPLPFTIPYVEGLLLSPLVLSFTLASYVFLLLSDLWRIMGKGILKGFLLTAVGTSVFVLYRMNVA